MVRGLEPMRAEYRGVSPAHSTPPGLPSGSGRPSASWFCAEHRRPSEANFLHSEDAFSVHTVADGPLPWPELRSSEIKLGTDGLSGNVLQAHKRANSHRPPLPFVVIVSTPWGWPGTPWRRASSVPQTTGLAQVLAPGHCSGNVSSVKGERKEGEEGGREAGKCFQAFGCGFHFYSTLLCPVPSTLPKTEMAEIQVVLVCVCVGS